MTRLQNALPAAVRLVWGGGSAAGSRPGLPNGDSDARG